MSNLSSTTSATNLALTARQRMIWIEDELHPGVPCNNVLTQLVIRGQLDPDRFAAAFAVVRPSFDALRLRVANRGGELVQELSAEPATPLEIVNLQETEDGKRAYAEWLQERCKRTFGFGEVLVDAVLVAIAADHWVFYLNQHHSITDGLSCVLLIQALERAYRGERPRVAASYTEFLDDESAYCDSAQFAADRQFWGTRFATRPEPQRLYGQDPRCKAGLTERVSHTLSSELSQAIWDLTSEVSLSQVFATTLFAYLQVVTGASDLSIGVPLLNRGERFRESVGLLMEICPTRLAIGEDPTFASILAGLRQQITKVREHRRHSMTSRFGGYEVLLNVHTESCASFAGMPAEYELTTPLNLLDELPNEHTGHSWGGREALTVQVHHSGPDRRLVVSFDCNRGAFADPRQRQRALAHFTLMLAAFVANRDRKIHSVDLLTTDERALLFPKEESAFARGERVESVVERFATQVARSPDSVALVHGDVELTYRELDTKVRCLATVLREQDVGSGDLVGICLDRSTDLPVALLATMTVGAAYVPIDPHHPADRIAVILEDAKPRLLVSNTRMWRQLGEQNQDRVLLLDIARDRIEAAAPDASEPTDAQLAYVIFTSGSTGRPKGVRVTHHGLSTFLAAMAEAPGLCEADRLLAVTTVSFDIAGLELYLPLIVGATVHLADATTAMDGEALARLLKDADISVLQATPATYRMLLQAGWAGKPDLQVLCGGEAMSVELAETLLPRVRSLWNMYGPTETTVWSTIHPVLSSESPIPIGRPIPGTQTFVLNQQQIPVPIGVSGELFIAGDGVAEGYHDRPDLTAKRFVPNPFSVVSGATMYRTGDLVRTQLSGDLEYIGRADFQVKVRGFRIELGEIEAVLEKHDQVRQAVVVTRPDASGEMGLVGYLIPKTAEWDVGAVRDHLRHKLPAYMVPPVLVPLDEFPLTPNAKVDRKALPAMQRVDVAADDRDYVAPRSDLETHLSMIWEELLGLPRVGIHDSFFDLGGHSLLALRLTSRIRDELGAPIELVQVFSSPTIAELARALKDSALTTGRTVIPLQRRGDGTPVFCLCGINLYQGLSHLLGEDQPFYGLYIPEEEEIFSAMKIGEDPADYVRYLAEAYYATIRGQHGDAPLSLLGFCFGGILAFEVARLAARDGIAVDRLILVDTVLWDRLRRSQWKRVKYHLSKLLAGGPTYIVDRIRARRGRPVEAAPPDEVALDETSRINALAARARSYSPGGTFGGSVLFVRASDRDLLGTWVDTPLLGWENVLTGPNVVIDIVGPHSQILREPLVRKVAEKLGPLL